jgi:hypothetical protein
VRILEEGFTSAKPAIVAWCAASFALVLQRLLVPGSAPGLRLIGHVLAVSIFFIAFGLATIFDSQHVTAEFDLENMFFVGGIVTIAALVDGTIGFWGDRWDFGRLKAVRQANGPSS